MKQMHVYVTKEQEEWLKNHPEFNLSGFARKKLDELIKNGTPPG